MGCTLNYTAKDHVQTMKSLGKRVSTNEPLNKARREKIRAALNRTSSETLQTILSNPNHPAYGSVSRLLAKSVGQNMTQAELQKLPEAFSTILKKQPNAMGLFKKAPAHRGPGASAVQHHYEIFSAAALIESKYHTVSGKVLSIGPGDRVDFGMKFAGGYAQPKRYGTIEADILVSKSSVMSHKTVAIDSKFSDTGNYGAKDGLQRQLDGIRTGLRDGKIHEFCFVTNGIFGEGFKGKVQAENLEIARDYAKRHNRLYQDEKKGIDRAHLTEEEKKTIPPGKIPESFFREDNEKVKEFVNRYDIPQIDMCQHVKYPGT